MGKTLLVAELCFHKSVSGTRIERVYPFWFPLGRSSSSSDGLIVLPGEVIVTITL